MKFTGSVSNPEQRVAYFGEDVGMNAHHAHWHMDHPFWWKKTYDQRKSRKGELFFYMHHQMVARSVGGGVRTFFIILCTLWRSFEYHWHLNHQFSLLDAGFLHFVEIIK